jgi:hypothetical protein
MMVTAAFMWPTANAIPARHKAAQVSAPAR